MDFTPYRQADPRWSKQRLGEGASTLGRGGCLLVCLAMASERILGEKITPDMANERLRGAGAFHGSGLIVERAAKALGLHQVDRIHKAQSTLQLMQLIDEAIITGGVAILHVSHNGDEDGDHFVMAFDLIEEGYRVADPATGEVIILDEWGAGESNWAGKMKKYKTTGAIFIGKDEV